jgi:hypothetical protein
MPPLRMLSIKITVARTKCAVLVGESSGDSSGATGSSQAQHLAWAMRLTSIDNSAMNQVRQARAGELPCGIAAGYWAAARGGRGGGVGINESLRPSQLSHSCSIIEASGNRRGR